MTRAVEARALHRAKAAISQIGFAPVDPVIERTLDAQILHDIAPYYGELECGFASTHLPRIGTVMPSPGFSTLAKLAWAILDCERVIGKVVCTVKRNGAWKVGPIAVMPEHRKRGHAAACLASIVRRAHSTGWWCVVATVPRGNIATKRLFARVGFCLVGELVDHYRAGSVEDVVVSTVSGPMTGGALETARSWRAAVAPLERLHGYVGERFFPVDAGWRQWLARCGDRTLEDFAGKPHDVVHRDGAGTALVIYKRGGAAKIVPIVDGNAPPAMEVVEACERAARERARHKAAMFLPAEVPAPPGYRCELVAERYALRGPIALWSRRLD
jgi:ribosomal protein S18 acetylase RimI-like enzyme